MEGEWAIWWHDAGGSTHVHGQTFATEAEAADAAERLNIPSPILHLL